MTDSNGGKNSLIPSQEWKFLQCFGERVPGEEIQEADIISAVEFDSDGSYLATGDKGGRVVLFEKVPIAQQNNKAVDDTSQLPQYEYRYMTEFQSHEPEFDYLKSQEIEEKVNKIRWLKTCGNTRMLLSTNDKTVKLWKAYEKVTSYHAEYNLDLALSSGFNNSAPRGNLTFEDKVQLLKKSQGKIQKLKIPRVSCKERNWTSKCKQQYTGAHTYHTNSISVNSDQETFLSADDLRINIWNLEQPSVSFNVVDLKPDNMEELMEVITCAEYHPEHCHIFVYSTSRGTIYVADQRAQALCENGSKQMQANEQRQSFFSEIINSVSDLRWLRNGYEIVSRDFMTVKVWDIRKEQHPVVTINCHEHLRNKLVDLYENDFIFDKFGVTMDGAGQRIAVGSYNNLFRVFDRNSNDVQNGQWVEASRDPMRTRGRSQANRQTNSQGRSPEADPAVGDAQPGTFSWKLLHSSWHPKDNIIAVGACNSLYIYCQP